jgi:hypothetical protein
MPSSLGHTHAALMRPKDQAHVQLGWLLEEPCLDVPPVELILEHCLLGILRQRVCVQIRTNKKISGLGPALVMGKSCQCCVH